MNILPRIQYTTQSLFSVILINGQIFCKNKNLVKASGTKLLYFENKYDFCMLYKIIGTHNAFCKNNIQKYDNCLEKIQLMI